MNRKIFFFTDAQEFVGAVEWEKYGTRRVRSGWFAFFGDEAAANGVVDPGIEDFAIRAEGRKAHAIGMAWEQSLFVKNKVSGFKRNGVLVKKLEQAGFPNRFDVPLDLARIDFIGLPAGKSE